MDCWWFVIVRRLAIDWLGDSVSSCCFGYPVMKELLKLRDRLLGEYEDAIDTMDIQGEADGLLVAIRLVEDQIDHIIEKAGI